ncbi:hypothetical protein QJQ45_023754 [Haematococcus lacustris]|nr:hypothetical protein QJQ45_023754 [Haematococcus lacustris]
MPLAINTAMPHQASRPTLAMEVGNQGELKERKGLEEEAVIESQKRGGPASSWWCSLATQALAPGACRKVVDRANSGEPTDRVPGQVVTVDEFRTSSTMNSPQPCEEELDRSKPTRLEGWKPPAGQVQNRLVQSAWSKRLRRQWPHRARLPAQGKEYPTLGFKKLRDRAPKAQAQQPVAQEQRILARRKRIQERLAAMREGDNAGGKEGEKKEEVGKGKAQIIESKRKLYKFKHRTDQDVSSVRVAGDERENAHRVAEENTRQELRAKLLAEAEQSARQNAAVAMRWADLFSIDVPQDLYMEIERQRMACEKIIGSKDKLIHEIKTELKKKDDEFVKTLKRQAEDIDTLLQYMSRQFVEMQNAYKEELEEIENAFLQERSDLLDSNRKEMTDLFDKRSKMEADFMERYLSTVEKYQGALEALRISDAEDYHILKIRLETDIQNLEQHLEAMRATYQLNTEKLEYNYRVLVERDHENQATINQQKRKISRQRDILSGLKARYAETERKHIEENMRLTDEYKRITEQFKDLQGKFRHFETVDTKKYAEVWAMKEAEVAAKVRQLLQADKVIHEQQLGWAWAPPDDALFVPTPLAPPPAAASAATTQQGEGSGQGTPGSRGAEGEEQVGEGEEVSEEEVAARRAEKELQERLRSPAYLGALSLLADEAGFLVDSKVRAMLDKLPKDEAGLLAAESIVRAVGVTDGTGFAALMDALSADSTIEGKAKGIGGTSRLGGDDPPSSQGGQADAGSRAQVLVHPDDVVRRLRAFVELESAAPTRSGLAGPSRAVGAVRRAAELEQEFWSRMTHVINEKGTRVWRALEKQLERYLALLHARATSLSEVDSLQHQNAELRALLNQYLSSRINEELQIPPTQII